MLMCCGLLEMGMDNRKAAGESDQFEKEEFARLAAQAKVLKEKKDALWAEPEPEEEVRLPQPACHILLVRSCDSDVYTQFRIGNLLSSSTVHGVCLRVHNTTTKQEETGGWERREVGGGGRGGHGGRGGGRGGSGRGRGANTNVLYVSQLNVGKVIGKGGATIKVWLDEISCNIACGWRQLAGSMQDRIS